MKTSKTLEQLWKENGEKTGLKVKKVHWGLDSWFVILAVTPKGEYIGYNSAGEATGSNSFSNENWEIYREPEEIVDHWPALVECNDGSLFVSGSVYNSIEKALKDYSAYTHVKYIRLATELPPIKTSKKKVRI